MIVVLFPPLKLQDILSLMSSGTFYGNVDGALVFRVNSLGPTVSKFTQRLATRISKSIVIIVSLGKVPRLGFSLTGQSLLSEIPSVESPSSQDHYGGKEENNSKHTIDPNGIVIREHVLELIGSPISLCTLWDTHVDHLQDIVTRFEMELDTIDLELDKSKQL